MISLVVLPSAAWRAPSRAACCKMSWFRNMNPNSMMLKSKPMKRGRMTANSTVAVPTSPRDNLIRLRLSTGFTLFPAQTALPSLPLPRWVTLKGQVCKTSQLPSMNCHMAIRPPAQIAMAYGSLVFSCAVVMSIGSFMKKRM